MSTKKIALITFILVALIQVYVPAKIILDQEKVLTTGKEFKFKTAPIDPNDPFRGKYITLSYAENTVTVPEKEEWIPGELAYVSVTTNPAGFAKIKAISKTKPTASKDFFKAKVSFIINSDTNQVTIDFPFDRYYLEESKAYAAEQTYQKALADTTQTTYALVKVQDGHAVLEDVLIGGTPIRELVKVNQKK